jgi:RHS repeat-associated protein
MERDEESGLNYHGARYYASWLGRWTASDPSGLIDGPNLYCYVGDNPMGMVDLTGNEGNKPERLPPSPPEDVAVFEVRDAAFEAGKKLETGVVKATRKGKELPPPKGKQLEIVLKGNSKNAKELRLKYATKQGIEAGDILRQNITERSAASAAGVQGGHFGQSSQKLVPEVGFHKGTVISVGKNPGGEPKGARTADLVIAHQETPPSQYSSIKGQRGPAAFSSAGDMKLGAGRVADQAGFKKASGGLVSTELRPGTKGLRVTEAIAGKLFSAIDGLNWINMGLEYYHTGGITLGVAPNGDPIGIGMHNVQQWVGWTPEHMLWIPDAFVDAYIKCGLLKEGDSFAEGHSLSDMPPELHVIRDGKPVATGYLYRPDEDAFIRHLDEPPLM